MSQRTLLPELEFRLLLLKGEGVWLVVADVLVSESFVFASLNVGQVTMFL